MGSVYALLQPRTGEVRYVGQTRGSVAMRVRGHLYAAERGYNVRVLRWIRSLDESDPTVKVLEDDVPNDELDVRERRWIHHYLRSGHRLTNVAHTVRPEEVQSPLTSSS